MAGLASIIFQPLPGVVPRHPPGAPGPGPPVAPPVAPGAPVPVAPVAPPVPRASVAPAPGASVAPVAPPVPGASVAPVAPAPGAFVAPPHAAPGAPRVSLQVMPSMQSLVPDGGGITYGEMQQLAAATIESNDRTGSVYVVGVTKTSDGGCRAFAASETRITCVEVRKTRSQPRSRPLRFPL